MDPRRLEAFADQEYISTRALGMRDPGATQMRRSRQLAGIRNTGRRFEKFDEDKTRVFKAEDHPGVEGLIGNRDGDPSYRLVGVPPVQYQELLEPGAPLSVQFPPYKFKPEFFSVNHTRGVDLESLDVDPGPQYAISHGRPPVPGSENNDVAAPTLLGVTRAVQATFGNAEGAGEEGAAQDGAGTVTAGFVTATPTGGIPAAGAAHGLTIALNGTRTRQAVESTVDYQYDLSQSAGQQWPGTLGRAGAGGAAVDITPVGGQVAIVTTRDPRLARGSLLAETKPVEGALGGGHGTMADYGVSGGVVIQEGVAGPGAPTPLVQTVVHPLDAFPGTRRLIAEEKAGQIEAERFRKSVMQAAVRRQYITQAMHPHGVLGVDSQNNEDSAFYGELAATRRAAREAATVSAAAREERLQVYGRSDARRGYEFTKDAQPDKLGASARLAGPVAPVAVAAAQDGIKFNAVHQVEKHHSPDLVGESIKPMGGTRRVMTGEFVPGPPPRAAAHADVRMKHFVQQTTRGRDYDPVTGLYRPPAMQPSLNPVPGFSLPARPRNPITGE